MLYFAETGMWVDTSANFFSVAGFSNGLFWPWPYGCQYLLHCFIKAVPCCTDSTGTLGVLVVHWINATTQHGAGSEGQTVHLRFAGANRLFA